MTSSMESLPCVWSPKAYLISSMILLTIFAFAQSTVSSFLSILFLISSIFFSQFLLDIFRLIYSPAFSCLKFIFPFGHILLFVLYELLTPSRPKNGCCKISTPLRRYQPNMNLELLNDYKAGGKVVVKFLPLYNISSRISNTNSLKTKSRWKPLLEISNCFTTKKQVIANSKYLTKIQQRKKN